MKKADVYAKHKHAGVSPKKVAIVMDLVRGADLVEAKKTLAFDKTKAAKMVLKVVRSAESNAVNNHDLSLDKLYVSDIYVNPGRVQRWGRAGSKGRYDPLRKRYSHIVVGLSVRGEETTKKDMKAKKESKKTKKTKVKKEEK